MYTCGELRPQREDRVTTRTAAIIIISKTRMFGIPVTLALL